MLTLNENASSVLAALDEKAVSFSPNEGRTVSVNTGVMIPSIHRHESERLTWLHIDDELVRVPFTARTKL